MLLKKIQRQGARKIDERRRTQAVRRNEAIERNEAYESFSSLNGTALSSELQPRFCLFAMIFRKKDLRISLITHDLDLTLLLSIPLFQTLFAGLITVRVATHSSLRAFSKRMILNPAILPLERHSCPISSTVFVP